MKQRIVKRALAVLDSWLGLADAPDVRAYERAFPWIFQSITRGPRKKRYGVSA
jgi:primosomal protein N'